MYQQIYNLFCDSNVCNNVIELKLIIYKNLYERNHKSLLNGLNYNAISKKYQMYFLKV